MKIVRTDKADGSETEVDVHRFKEIISRNYAPNACATIYSEAIRSGEDVNTAFAYYRVES